MKKNSNKIKEIEKLNNIFFEPIKKNNKKVNVIEKVNEHKFENAKNVNNNKKESNLKVSAIMKLNYEGNKKEKNKNNCLKIEKTKNLNFERVKNNKFKNLSSTNALNLFYEKTRINKKIELYLDNAQRFSLESKEKEKNINKENINKNKIFKIIKNDNFSFINNNKKIRNSFKNNSIEKLNSITYEKILKENQNKNNKYEIQKESNFSLISDKENNNNIIKSNKFENLSIYKDIKNNLFFEKNEEDDDDDNSLFEDINEIPKREASNKSINKANPNNTSIFGKSEEKIEKKVTFKKNSERMSKAFDKARKRTQTLKYKKTPHNNDLMSKNLGLHPDLLNAEQKNTRGKFKYRQSLRIMEIAKQLEKEIIKDGENKNEENDSFNENNTEYRNSIAIDLIALKPVDNKKKKKKKSKTFIEEI